MKFEGAGMKIERRGAARCAGLVLAEPKCDDAEDGGTEEGSSGNGKNPGVDDAARNAPADSGKTAGGANANDGSGDGVRGADGNAELRGGKERDGAGGFRREAPEGIELGNALAHGFDDAPASGHGAPCHGEMAAINHPVGNSLGILQQAARHQGGGDDPHAFLSVVGAVAEAIESSGNELQPTEPAIDSQRTLLADDPTGQNSDEDGDHHPDQGRKKNEKNGLKPAAKDNGPETGVRHGGATVAGNQRVRGAGGQSENESDQIPGDRAEKAGKDHFFVDHLEANQALGDGLGDRGAEPEGG